MAESRRGDRPFPIVLVRASRTPPADDTTASAGGVRVCEGDGLLRRGNDVADQDLGWYGTVVEAPPGSKARIRHQPRFAGGDLWTHGHCGEKPGRMGRGVANHPEYSLEHRRTTLPYNDPADFEQIRDGLRKAGLVT